MSLSENDRRVLGAIQRAMRDWDGFAPHGAADWCAIRRLRAAELVADNGFAVCQDCPGGEHEESCFVLTDSGKKVVEEADP